MPIEIRELSVTASVSPNTAPPNTSGGQGGGGGADQQQMAQKQKEELVKECVEKVMQLLHDKKER